MNRRIYSLQVYSLAEGASNPHALLGMIRLAHYLATSGTLDPNQPCQFVIDSGTGTTAIGTYWHEMQYFTGSELYNGAVLPQSRCYRDGEILPPCNVQSQAPICSESIANAVFRRLVL